MTIEVIGAGFGRTGTLSLKTALEELGFAPCDHMITVYADPARAKCWADAADQKARGEPIDWSRVLGGLRATVDWPGCYFWRELVVAYPDAKVILTVRDPDRWYDSARDTIYWLRALASRPGPRALPFRLGRTLIPGANHIFRLADDAIWNGTFDGRFDDRDYTIAIYNRHIAAVKAGLPPERLLIYEIKDGWQPLCDFLGLPVPMGIPFPRLNDAAHFQRRVRWQFAAGTAALAVVLGVLIGGTAAIHRLASGSRPWSG